jgi:hypothetical protein
VGAAVAAPFPVHTCANHTPNGGTMTRNESEIEATIDRRVQARLATDRDYLFAEDAEVQALAERKIELQEERAVLLAAGTLSDEAARRVDDIASELTQVFAELRRA